MHLLKKNIAYLSFLIVLTFTIISPQEIYGKLLSNPEEHCEHHKNLASQKIKLTEEEQTWLKNNPDITFAFPDNLEPALMKDANNKYIGILADFLVELNLRLGSNFKLKSFPNLDILDKIKKKEIDGHFSIIPERATLLGLLKTNPTFTVYPTVFTQRNAPFTVNNFKDLKGKSISAVADAYLFENILGKYKKDLTLKKATSSRHSLDLLFTGKVDAALGYSINNFLITKYSMTSITPAYTDWNSPIDGVIGVRPDLPILHSILNKGLANFSQADKNTILTKWLTSPYNTKKLYLTGNEKLWLKEHPVIRVACDAKWAPIESKNEQGEYEGISIDYLNLIEKSIPVEFKIATETLWTKLIKKAKDKEVDFFTGIVSTPERERFLSFSTPYISLPILIYTKDNVSFIPNLNSLNGKKVAVVEGYSIHKWLNRDYPSIEVVPCKNIVEALTKVTNNEAFAYTGNLMSTGYYILKKGFINIKAAGETEYSYNLQMAVRKDWPIFKQIIQKVLNNISTDQKNSIYNKWITVRYEQQFNYALLWQILSIVFIIILFFIWSNIRLRNAVKKRTEELTSTEEQYSTLFESANDAIVILKDSKIVMCNKKTLELFQYESSKDLIGLKPYHLSPLFQNDQRLSDEKAEEKIADALAGNPQLFEWQNKKRNGEVFHTIVTLSPFKMHNEHCLLALVRDITDKKKAEQELIMAKEKAEESDKLKTAFLAGLSHEIRTPMNGILGFAQLLKDSDLSPDEQSEYIQTIERSGHRMLNIINDLIDISRIESNQLRLHKTKTSINDLMKETYNFFKLQAKNKGIELNLVLPQAQNEIIIEIDKERISQVLSNLLTNAFKFTKEGTITFGYEQKENMLAFYVKDTGIGIENKMQDVIFERFRQINITYSRSHEGAGLGLSICKAFIQKHGGNIWVESIPEQGSTFHFTIPFSNKTQKLYTSDKSLTQVPSIPKDTKILIAEDDPSNCLLLEKILSKYEISTICVNNGQEAVDMINQRNDIDLILMDLQMPTMDGITATKVIKKQHPDIPIIAQSAFVSEQDIQAAIDSECSDFITKPIDQHILMRSICKFLPKN